MMYIVKLQDREPERVSYPNLEKTTSNVLSVISINQWFNPSSLSCILTNQIKLAGMD